MSPPTDREEALRYLRAILTAFVGNDEAMLARDLSVRQLAILLSVRLDTPAHTMSGLAERLGVTKAVISRALDTLEYHGILVRERDVYDQRILKVRCTDLGARYVDRLVEIMQLSSALETS